MAGNESSGGLLCLIFRNGHFVDGSWRLQVDQRLMWFMSSCESLG